MSRSAVHPVFCGFLRVSLQAVELLVALGAEAGQTPNPECLNACPPNPEGATRRLGHRRGSEDDIDK